MRQILISLFALTVSVSSFANDFAAVIGVRSNSWDLNPSAAGQSASGKTGFQGGVLGFIDLAPMLQFRGGFEYVQRNFTTSSSLGETNYNYTYFDIPLTLMYKFSDFGGIFGGAVLALNAGKSCSAPGAASCSTDGVKSSLVGYQIGASFKFAPQMGAELYYEGIPGDLQSASGQGIGNSKSIAANLLITFE